MLKHVAKLPYFNALKELYLYSFTINLPFFMAEMPALKQQLKTKNF